MDNLNVLERVFEGKKRKIKVYPCHTNRASELGHPCERYLVYNRTQWEEKQIHSVESQFIFDHGNVIEDEAIQELKDAGFEISEQQRSFQLEESITGHLDLMISNGDENRYPCEIKGLSHWDWIQLNTIEDFFNSKKPWIRKYPAQLMLYLYGTNKEKGFFYIKDKQAPHLPKVIWVYLDYGYTESLLQKAARINRHVADKTLPDKIEYEPTVCDRCSFSHVCLPDKSYGDGVSLISDPEFEDILNRKNEIQSLVSEYEKLRKIISEKVKGVENAICGNWHISGQWCERKTKAREATTTKYWKPKIQKIEKPKESK